MGGVIFHPTCSNYDYYADGKDGNNELYVRPLWQGRREQNKTPRSKATATKRKSKTLGVIGLVGLALMQQETWLRGCGGDSLRCG